MFRGFYTAASGMLSQMRREQMATNNLANSDTPGYKADRSSLRAFPQMLLERIGGDGTPGKTPIGGLATGVYVQETMPKFLQGDLVETGNHSDVALLQVNVPDEGGALFFAVQHTDGEIRYTRNGNFTVDGAGRLTDNHGDLVLSTNGQSITVADGQFSIEKDGTVMSSGNEVGQVQVVYATNPMNLVKEGNDLFYLNEGRTLPSAAGNANMSYQIKQKYLERSNVDNEQSMVQLMTAFRNFQANQKVLQAYDSTMQKSVNEVGRIG